MQKQQEEMADSVQKKYAALLRNLKRYKKVAIAYSSGVDSTFLLMAAVEALGKENVLAITANFCSLPKRELEETKHFCGEKHIPHVVMSFDAMQIDGFRQNPVNRCYLCKKELFQKIIMTAEQYGIFCVVEGSNMDDCGDYRPGLKAVKELQVKSPLQECGFYKKEIRALSQKMGLYTYNKPSFACLASRFVYGEEITEEKLAMVDRAEQFFLDRNFTQVRVRMHGLMARIEVLPQDFDRFIEEDFRNELAETLKKIGFTYVTLDLTGYRTGSMNEIL